MQPHDRGERRKLEPSHHKLPASNLILQRDANSPTPQPEIGRALVAVAIATDVGSPMHEAAQTGLVAGELEPICSGTYIETAWYLSSQRLER